LVFFFSWLSARVPSLAMHLVFPDSSIGRAADC
jgi:hypothetical protein